MAKKGIGIHRATAGHATGVGQQKERRLANLAEFPALMVLYDAEDPQRLVRRSREQNVPGSPIKQELLGRGAMA